MGGAIVGGAAVEGAIHGIQSMAISMAYTKNIDFSIGSEFAFKMVGELKANMLPKDTLLNVNIPNTSKDDLKGVKVTTLGIRRYKNAFEKRHDPRGNEYYWLSGEVINEIQGKDSDINAIKDNFISMTPIHYDLTKFDLIQTIENWNIQF